MKKIISLIAIVFILASPMIGASSAFAAAAGATVGTVTTYDSSVVISGVVFDPTIAAVLITYSSGSDAEEGGEVTGPVNAKGSFSIQLDGLKPSTRYYYQIIAPDHTQLTAPLEFTTKSSVYGFSVINISATKASVSGTFRTTKPDLLIKWGEADLTEFQHSFVPTITSYKFLENLTDLSPNKEYKVRLFRASNESVPLSGVYLFTTPDIFVVPSVVGLGAESATVSAQLPANLTDVKVSYGVRADELKDTVAMKADGTTYTAELKGLTPETQYFYKVLGTDETGASKMYTRESFTFWTIKKQDPAPKVGVLKDIVGPITPSSGSSSTGLVTCSGVDDFGNTTCTFKDLLRMINGLVEFIIFYILPAIATLMLVVAGIGLVFSGGSTEQVEKSKALIKKAVGGIVIVMVAWMLVKTVLVALGYDTSIFPDYFGS